MDALIAKADSIAPVGKRPSSHSHKRSSKKPHTSKSVDDATFLSVGASTSVPKSLPTEAPEGYSVPSNRHVKDVKLRGHLNRMSNHSILTKSLIQDAQFLLTEQQGRIEPEGELEKTWRTDQDEIVRSVGEEVGKQRREWKLDGGSYKCRYSRNGRHLAIAGKNGHVASFDWRAGTLHSELQLRETLRDITYLHDQSFVAVAQKQYIFIYDQSGVEVHRLSSHVEVNRLEFLPFHWLLASIGNAGYLKYTDTSTGQTICEQRTKLGACDAMAQNVHNAVIHLGHQNGTVTLRTPNLPTAPVTLLAHLGPVTSLSVDPSSGGRYMATAGADSRVKVWDCRNWKGCVREWSVRSASSGVGIEVEWSQKGLLGVASGGSVNVYTPPTIHTSHSGNPPLYITHSIPPRPLTSLRFCPFTDTLTIGHAEGLSSIIVPGAGEPNFDSAEADPFEGKKARREREVRGLLDKIQPDLITLQPEFIGSLAPPTPTPASAPSVVPFARLPRLERLKVSGKAADGDPAEGDVEMGADGSEEDKDGASGGEEDVKEKEKMKMRGKGKSLKRYLRKKRKNVIDPSTVAIRMKIEAQKEQRRKEREKALVEGEAGERRKSALDRFRK